MNNGDANSLMQLLPFIVIGLVWAIPNYFLAKRLNKSPILWSVLTVIPIFNFFFSVYVAYRVVYAVLDRLKAIQDALGTRDAFN